MKSLIYRLLIMLLIVALAFPMHAQIWLSNEDIFDDAEEYLNAEEYIEALPLYMLLEKKEIINAHIAYKMGTCYLNIRGKKSLSIPYLESACESISDSFENTFSETNAPLKALLLLGVAYRINNQLPEAVSTFQRLKDLIQDKDPDFVSVIDIHLRRCENAKLLNAFPGEPRTVRLPDNINTPFSNYNPVLVGRDSILYYMEELKFYDALMRVRNIDGEWGNPENLTPSIGSDGDHILVGASADGNTLFLYYYEPLKAGELYFTKFDSKDKWSPITPLNGNINTVYHETHASLSMDGKTLYFTSNREGGYGGLDIYKSVFDSVKNEWGPAQNLGSRINTPFNEETPIINADDEILYFSSQGHLNMGGYDIFYALRKGENEWRQPINMGSPVCTTDDDLFYYPLEEHVSGLMSRLDNPGTAYDIYRYNSMVFANTPRFTVKGVATDIDTASFSDYSIAIVNNENKDTLQYVAMPPDGNYEVVLPAGDFNLVLIKNSMGLETTNIILNDEEPEAEILAESFTTKIPGDDDNAGSIHDTPLASAEQLTETSSTDQSIKTLIEVVKESGEEIEDLEERSTPKMDTIRLKHILYSFDDYQLSKEYQQYLNEIQAVLIKYPSLKFEVEGHTDSKGPASYNISLSEKRAKEVVEFMVSGDIERNRFQIDGKGEEFPAAINSNPDGTDNLQARKFNRRVVLIPNPEIEGLIFLQVNTIPKKYRIKTD